MEMGGDLVHRCQFWPRHVSSNADSKLSGTFDNA